jgi:hypothetical protein
MRLKAHRTEPPRQQLFKRRPRAKTPHTCSCGSSSPGRLSVGVPVRRMARFAAASTGTAALVRLAFF